MGLVKKVALAMALFSASIFGGNALAEDRVLGNEYMHGKIEKYFEKYPNRRVYQDEQDKDFLFLGKRGRNVAKFKKICKSTWTPKTLNNFLQKNILYVLDTMDGHKGTEYMKSPLEFYLTGKGDCEDFANFADDVLSKNGYETSIVALRCIEEAHAICYIQTKKGYAYIDPTGYYEFTNLKDLRKHASRFFTKKNWTAGSTISPDYSQKSGIKVLNSYGNPEIVEEIINLLMEFPVEEKDIIEMLKFPNKY